jgi:hypothetical protein
MSFVVRQLELNLRIKAASKRHWSLHRCFVLSSAQENFWSVVAKHENKGDRTLV